MLVAGKERCIRCMHLLDEEGHCAKCEFDASSYKQPNMALPLGTCLNERYFLGKVLGEGGFGITYVAWDIVLMVPVAVKEYFPSGIATREKEGPQTGTLQIYEGKSELEFEKGKEDFCKLYGVKFSPGCAGPSSGCRWPADRGRRCRRCASPR